MWLALGELGASLPDDVRVVVVTGEGDTFSAGLDRAMLDPANAGEGTVLGLLALSDEEASARIEEFQRGFTWLRDPRFVSIAKVRGHAIGAGFQLALSCDLRVVADDAKFSMKESALGLVPDLTGTKPLVEHVGYARALEICATARVVPGRGGRRGSASPRPACRRPSSTPPSPTLPPRWSRRCRVSSPRPRRCSRARPTATSTSSGASSGRRRYAASARSPPPSRADRPRRRRGCRRREEQ